MKEGYKDSVIGKIPEDWTVNKLGDVCDTRDGTHDSPKYFEEGIPFITSKNLTDTGLDFTNIKYISHEDHLNFSKRSLVENGDILFGMIGTIGKPVIVDAKFEFSIKNVALLKFGSNQLLNNVFALNSLKSSIILKQFSKEKNGGVLNFVSLGNIRNLIFPIPPLPEQEKIAEILSTVDEKIAVINERIVQTQELKKGLMQRLLSKGIGHAKFKSSPLGDIPESWEIFRIGNITTVVRGASPRPKGDPLYYGGNIPRLMGEDVTRDGKYVTPKKDYLTDEGAKRSRFVPAGTLTMVCSGNVGVPSILAVDACVHDGFLAFPEISEGFSIEFLYYVFDSLRSKFNSSATHGGIFTNLTTSIIKEFEIAFPKLEEQEKIAETLSTVDEKLGVLQEKKEQYQEMKNGLMQQLLTGKLRVNHLIEQPELA